MSDQTATFKEWIGRSRREDDELSIGPVRRWAAMLDRDPAAYRRGSEVPESWYAILFGPTARQSKMGPDGHPLTGDDLLPPLHNTRRMFAGRRAAFHQPLRVGDIVERVSTVRKVEPKSGRTGNFVLMTVVHELTATGTGLVITEEQDLVYREAVGTTGGEAKSAQQAKPQTVAEKPDRSIEWNPDTVQLFRYSALTFNAHRIHYDLPYTREVEGYPGLVINGGLIALMLVEAARPILPRAIAGYDARAMAPLFIGQTVLLNSRIVGDTVETWATTPEGGLHYRVNISLKKS